MTGSARSPAARWVVFTDLDGTLLDARTYSASPARPALAALAARGVPVVFCSSKTAAEQRPIRRELGLERAPFIVENGSAVIVPAAASLPTTAWAQGNRVEGEFVQAIGRPAADVRAGVARAAAAVGMRVTGYADLSVRAIAGLTGLDEADAARARERDYSETLIDVLPAEAWTKLDAAFAVEGLRCQHGGRFHTVTATCADKGRAARVVAQLFASAVGDAVPSIGLGNSANDLDLLRAVDRPYLIARDDGKWAPFDVPNLRRIPRAGPEGWNEAIFALLGEA